MRTKYIHFVKGPLVLFSEASGMEHWEVAYRYFEDKEVADAGFAYQDGNRFAVYGSSVTLGVKADQFSADDLSTAMQKGLLRIREFPHDHSYAVTEGEGEVVLNFDDLYRARILTGD